MHQARLQVLGPRNLVLGESFHRPHPEGTEGLEVVIVGEESLGRPFQEIQPVGVFDDSAVLEVLLDRVDRGQLGDWIVKLTFANDLDYLYAAHLVREKGYNTKKQTD